MIRDAFIHRLRARFEANANAENAAAQKAYMKSSMDFYGLKMPVLRSLYRETLKEEEATGKLPWEDARDTALALWRTAKAREERHAAIELTGIKRHRKQLTIETLPVFDEMITTGAWWDYVDVLAAHRLGAIFEQDEEAVTQAMRQWSVDGDLWRRRSAIICQLRRKAETDQGLLEEAILANVDRKEFWLRKAIGWALREYGKTEPDWVRAFVAQQEDRLSPLSRKEAVRLLK